MKHSVKRLLALSLAAVMVCAVCVISALAFPSYKDTLANGHKYTIYTALDKRMALHETSNNIQISASNWSNNQTFTIFEVSGEWYKIVGSSGKVVDVYGINKAPGTNVFPCSYNGGDNQLWKFVKDGDGYRIQSKLGTFLDVADGKSTNVQSYSESKTNRQLWYLEDMTNDQVLNVDYRFWDSASNQPLEMPYSIATPQSSGEALPMIYLRAGETKELTIQCRGKPQGRDIDYLFIDWTKNSSSDWSKEIKTGLSVKTANKDDFRRSGGINNVAYQKFTFSADSNAAGLYRARVNWHYVPIPNTPTQIGPAGFQFYIYVEPKA